MLFREYINIHILSIRRERQPNKKRGRKFSDELVIGIWYFLTAVAQVQSLVGKWDPASQVAGYGKKRGKLNWINIFRWQQPMKYSQQIFCKLKWKPQWHTTTHILRLTWFKRIYYPKSWWEYRTAKFSYIADANVNGPGKHIYVCL